MIQQLASAGARPLLHSEIGWLIATGKQLENAAGSHADFLLHPPLCFFYTMVSVSVFVAIYCRKNASPPEDEFEEREYSSDVSLKFGYLWSGFATFAALVLLVQSVIAIGFASWTKNQTDPAERKKAFVKYAAITCLVPPVIVVIQASPVLGRGV